MLQLKATAAPWGVSNLGVPGTRLSSEVRKVKLVGEGTLEMMYQPSNEGVCVEKYGIYARAYGIKPCGPVVVTVITLFESDMRRIGAVTRPKAGEPLTVVATGEAAEQPPDLSQAMTWYAYAFAPSEEIETAGVPPAFMPGDTATLAGDVILVCGPQLSRRMESPFWN